MTVPEREADTRQSHYITPIFSKVSLRPHVGCIFYVHSMNNILCLSFPRFMRYYVMIWHAIAQPDCTLNIWGFFVYQLQWPHLVKLKVCSKWYSIHHVKYQRSASLVLYEENQRVIGGFPNKGPVILSMLWASCQIRNIVGCTCAGNAGSVFPATAG